MGNTGKNLGNLLRETAKVTAIALALTFGGCHKPDKPLPEVYLDVSPSYGYSPLSTRMKVSGAGGDVTNNLRTYRLYIPGKNVIEKNQPIDTIIILRNDESNDKNYAIVGEVIDSEGNIGKKLKSITIHPARINRFVQPNDSTENYYGSGRGKDYNRKREPNNGDLEVMDEVLAGKPLDPNDKKRDDRLDIDGNGKLEQNDRDILERRIKGIINYLPAEWNELNREERRDWFEKMILIDKTNEIIPISNFNCDEHVYQTIINFNGFRKSDLKKFLDANPLYDTINNCRFNIPLDYLSLQFYGQDNTYLGGHAIATAMVGDDFYNMQDRENFETETDALNPDIGKDYIPSDHQEVFVRGFPLKYGEEPGGIKYVLLTDHLEYSFKDNNFTFVQANPKLEFVTKREK